MEYLWRAVRESRGKGPLEQAAITCWIRLYLIRAGQKLFRANAGSLSEHRHQMNETFLDI